MNNTIWSYTKNTFVKNIYVTGIITKHKNRYKMCFLQSNWFICNLTNKEMKKINKVKKEVFKHTKKQLKIYKKRNNLKTT